MNVTEKILSRFHAADPWARDLCLLLRRLIREEVPEAEETWKWGPHWEYKGMFLGIWHFKHHVSMVFFKGAALPDPAGLLQHGKDNARNRMIKFEKDTLVVESEIRDYIRAAAAFNASGRELPRTKPGLQLPEFMKVWLSHAGLDAAFEALTPGRKREHIQFLSSAKQPATLERRKQKSAMRILRGLGPDETPLSG